MRAATKEIQRFCTANTEIYRNMLFLMSIPGIGGITASHLLARIGDWREMGNVRQLDMMMPGLTGIELLRELNKEPRLGLIPCILTTSTHLKAKQLEILLHEFPSLRYVLQKPFALEALRAAFGAVLKPAAR